MPCRSGYEDLPSEEEMNLSKERLRIERIEQVHNTAILLERVLNLLGSKVPDVVLNAKNNPKPTLIESDYVTKDLCNFLRLATDDLKQKIREDDYGPYIAAWWDEHKKYDERQSSTEHN